MIFTFKWLFVFLAIAKWFAFDYNDVCKIYYLVIIKFFKDEEA